MILEQTFEVVPIDEVSLHPANARKGDVDKIKGSIEELGFYGACLVQRSTRYIIVGNHRWRSAKEAGETHIPVLWVDIEDELATRIAINDNRLGELGTWDQAILVAQLAELADTERGLAGMAFTMDDLADLTAAEASKDEERSADLLDSLDVVMTDPEHKVHLGQVYRLGPHVLIVASVTADHELWRPYLDTPEAVFCPHPSPYLPLSTLGDARPLVMVTSSLYLAGHVLDKWEAGGREYSEAA